MSSLNSLKGIPSNDSILELLCDTCFNNACLKRVRKFRASL